MTEQEFSEQVAAIRGKLDGLPNELRHRLGPLVDQIVDAHCQRRQLITEAMDALADLRLQVKYLVFDLEATRRENERLRHQLKDRGEG